ncbi:MAG: hypothetical protein RMK80_04960 [Pseudobdellovibrionaceae bacterium]|nr:hypothetical protein [Pseudobdellovibrionaceae bacterium]
MTSIIKRIIIFVLFLSLSYMNFARAAVQGTMTHVFIDSPLVAWCQKTLNLLSDEIIYTNSQLLMHQNYAEMNARLVNRLQLLLGANSGKDRSMSNIVTAEIDRTIKQYYALMAQNISNQRLKDQTIYKFLVDQIAHIGRTGQLVIDIYNQQIEGGLPNKPSLSRNIFWPGVLPLFVTLQKLEFFLMEYIARGSFEPNSKGGWIFPLGEVSLYKVIFALVLEELWDSLENNNFLSSLFACDRQDVYFLLDFVKNMSVNPFDYTLSYKRAVQIHRNIKEKLDRYVYDDAIRSNVQVLKLVGNQSSYREVVLTSNQRSFEFPLPGDHYVVELGINAEGSTREEGAFEVFMDDQFVVNFTVPRVDPLYRVVVNRPAKKIRLVWSGGFVRVSDFYVKVARNTWFLPFFGGSTPNYKPISTCPHAL